ncbi:tumor protein D52 isoform X2 [Sitodiplosis mosellana]|uniref:tumor protein D52 isoform X2 n=1 Tax=Sitodiplosis mosellana TaxID=263140 RepID=UPI002443E1DC|nr:tumor protein D52 isoform X2 [Sitodiplosis mosellana]
MSSTTPPYGSEKLSDTSPGAASISSVDIANEFASLSSEEQDRVRAEWSQELARVEEEIATLRTVLTSKVRHASELKRKLGITVWKEISDDMNQSLKNVRESHVFQKTESAIKTTAEKTSSILGGLTSGISSKLSQMKKSDSYRSIEERVGSAYENVKTKVSTSRSGSVHSFTDENNLDSHTSTAPQSPIIPEGKSIP